jgi:hypothetical protein
MRHPLLGAESGLGPFAGFVSGLLPDTHRDCHERDNKGKGTYQVGQMQAGHSGLGLAAASSQAAGHPEHSANSEAPARTG